MKIRVFELVIVNTYLFNLFICVYRTHKTLTEVFRIALKFLYQMAVVTKINER